MSQGMRLTFLRFGRLMDADLRREPPRADGFPTNAASARKGTSPAIAEVVGSISEICRSLSQPFFRSLSMGRW